MECGKQVSQGFCVGGQVFGFEDEFVFVKVVFVLERAEVQEQLLDHLTYLANNFLF